MGPAALGRPASEWLPASWRSFCDAGWRWYARPGGAGARWEGQPLRIEVFDNQIEPALKALKREMLKGGVFKEMKRRAYYEKPSVKRKRKQAEARKKRRKAARRSPVTAD